MHYRLLILCLLLLSIRTFAQRRVTLDLTRQTYDSTLNCVDVEINDVKRSYGYPNINEVSIKHEAKFSNATFRVTSDFSKAYFDSACDFRGAHFISQSAFSDARFYSLSSFIGASFDSTSYFSSAYFDSTSAFMGTNFNSGCFFSNAVFHSPCIFSGAHFLNETEFSNVQFRSLSNFSYTHFDSTVLFSGAEFHYTIFNNAEFRSKCAFNEAKFYSTTDFTSAHFYSSVNFSKANFDSIVNFSEVQFNKDVNFTEAHFKHNANLVLAKIKVGDNINFDFSHCVLPDTIDFSHNPTIFSGTQAIIDFTLADSLNGIRYAATKRNTWQILKHTAKMFFYPNDTTGIFKKHRINLYNTDVSKIRIDYDHFVFYASENENKDSVKTKIPTDIVESIYEGLLKNFLDRGQMDSYKRLDIDYKRYKAGLEPGEFSWEEFWWRFGYEKWRIFIHSIFLILLFSIINFFFIDQLNNKTSGIYYIQLVPEFSRDLFSNYNRYQRFFRRCWTSLLYTSIIFFLLTLKIDKIRFSRSVLGIIWVIVIHISGLICIGFMANWILHR